MPVVRRRENIRKKKLRDPNAGIRRSDIQARKRASLVRHDHDVRTRDTIFGQAALVTKGPYEVYFEVMAPGSNTGELVSDSGTLTLMGRSGVLHVTVLGNKGVRRSQIRVGDYITIGPGTLYTLSSGDAPADFLRIQSKDYFGTLEQRSAPIAPERENISVTISPAKTVSEDLTLAEPRKRRSYDPEYRKRVAEMQQQDKSGVQNRKKVTRQVRVKNPQTADEVFQHGRQFTSEAGVNQGINPRPLGADGAAALMQADMHQAGLINESE